MCGENKTKLPLAIHKHSFVAPSGYEIAMNKIPGNIGDVVVDPESMFSFIYPLSGNNTGSNDCNFTLSFSEYQQQPEPLACFMPDRYEEEYIFTLQKLMVSPISSIQLISPLIFHYSYNTKYP